MLHAAAAVVVKYRHKLLTILAVLFLLYLGFYIVIIVRVLYARSLGLVEIEWRLKEVERSSSVQQVQHGILLRMLRSLRDQITYENRVGVLVMACNRPQNLDRTLSQIIKYRSAMYHPSDITLEVIVSQDCADAATAALVQTYAQHRVTHIKQPDQSNIGASLNDKDRRFLGYFNIARHYKWALSHVFNQLNFSAVIVVEDDLDMSPDFFEYFSATLPLLRADQTLWCVSAWNDNGKTFLVSNDTELLYRTDFFPGLGWMLLRETWRELEPKWPPVFWDDWMRQPDQRKNRACIRPEVPRSSTFGREGTSKGQYYDMHLQYIKHSEKFVPFTTHNLSYLLQTQYDDGFVSMVYQLPSVSYESIASQTLPPDVVAVRLEYNSLENFKELAKGLGIMDDFKSGVPRMAYKGIVSTFARGIRIYLAPPQPWTGYNEKWV